MMRLMGAVLVRRRRGAGLSGGGQPAEKRTGFRQMEEGLALLERELELSAPPLSQLLERGGSRCQGPPGAVSGVRPGLDRLDREDFPACGGGWSRSGPS